MATGGGIAAGVTPSGVLLCLLAGLSYATYALVNQRMVAVASPAAVSATVFTFAALLAVPGAVGLSGVAQIHARDVAILLWLGVVTLEMAVGRAREGRAVGGWQGGTTRWAFAHKEEQRRQPPTARLYRVRSALTHKVKVDVRTKVSIHQGFLADESGQLPFLG